MNTEIEKKYIVEDLHPATMNNKTLIKVIRKLEEDGARAYKSNQLFFDYIGLPYLNRKGLHALHIHVCKPCPFDEYIALAEADQRKRFAAIEAEKEKLKEEALRKAERVAKTQRESEARRLADASAAAISYNEPRAAISYNEPRAAISYNEPRNKAKRIKHTLLDKYGIPTHLANEPWFNKGLRIVRKIDQVQRLTQLEICFMSTKGGTWATNSLWSMHHANEAYFLMAEFRTKRDPWLAVNASSHYRKCGHSSTADDMLVKIDVEAIREARLKSALYTTHGAVKRDLNEKEDAIRFGEKAHALTKKDYRPCTLLGAVYMEYGNHGVGGKWYEKAVKNGFSKDAMDAELKSIFRKANAEIKTCLRQYLLKIDTNRYKWAA